MSVAENLFRSLVSSLGITPEQVATMLSLVVQRMETLDAETAAFKRASAQMVAHYNARLDRIDTTLDLILQHLQAGRAPRGEAKPLLNGDVYHE